MVHQKQTFVTSTEMHSDLARADGADGAVLAALLREDVEQRVAAAAPLGGVIGLLVREGSAAAGVSGLATAVGDASVLVAEDGVGVLAGKLVVEPVVLVEAVVVPDVLHGVSVSAVALAESQPGGVVLVLVAAEGAVVLLGPGVAAVVDVDGVHAVLDLDALVALVQLLAERVQGIDRRAGAASGFGAVGEAVAAVLVDLVAEIVLAQGGGHLRVGHANDGVELASFDRSNFLLSIGREGEGGRGDDEFHDRIFGLKIESVRLEVESNLLGW